MWLTLVTAGEFGFDFLTCPPVTGETFPYASLSEYDLIYLRLHGVSGQPYLYGDGFQTAFSASGLLGAAPDLSKTVIFMEGCFGRQGLVDDALLQLDAEAVVFSNEETRNRRFTVGEAGRFGREFVRLLSSGRMGVLDALGGAERKYPKLAGTYLTVGDEEK